jgi:hypothetical protein
MHWRKWEQLMNRMHVIDENQKLQAGAIGFLHVWKQFPFTGKKQIEE